MTPHRRFPSTAGNSSGTAACARAAALLGLLCSAPALTAAPTHPHAPAFGPFDGGAPRPVARQGQKGAPRKAHPMVGEAAKVPGEGAPPPPLRLDPDVAETALVKPNAIGSGLSSNPLYLAALIYANVITRLDGPRCQHLPTCSRFASQAVARDGVVGILMGLDRLIQPGESSAVRRLPEVEGYGGMRFFDPLENYEWWHPERFTGLPPATAEEPLALSAAPTAVAQVTAIPSSDIPSSAIPSSAIPYGASPPEGNP